MIIDDNLLKRVMIQASESPRLRMNYNLHDSFEAKTQRMINVLLPGSVIPIHRHPQTAETNILLHGRLSVILYNEQAEETECHILDPMSGCYGIHIPPGQWHSVKVLSSSAILEVKDGPYIPLPLKDIMK